MSEYAYANKNKTDTIPILIFLGMFGLSFMLYYFITPNEIALTYSIAMTFAIMLSVKYYNKIHDKLDKWL